MENAFSKLENFLFDLLGLILPGIIFIVLVFFPLILIDVTTIPENDINDSLILSELSAVSKILSHLWDNESSILLFSFILFSYLIGHVIKVFSIIFYDIMSSLFDKSLNMLVKTICNYIVVFLNFSYRKFSGKDIFETKFFKWGDSVFKPIPSILNKVFVFQPANYIKDNDSLKTKCVQIINMNLNTNFPDVWYSIYKFSTVIQNQ